jgi:L-ascorbate metabolism protein UlaG (beta-lactamase superfamily)
MMRLFPALICLLLPVAAIAADRPDSACLALASNRLDVVPVTYGDQIDQGAVLIRYLDHASFAIVIDDGTIAVTDYTGFIGNPDLVPDIVTMNNAHSSHFTDNPDPRIPHILRGWGPPGAPPRIELDLGSVSVRNITTDLRGPFGEGARRDGNSVFLFEAAGLCIAHLSHLHQIPTDAQFGAIGRVDVVMVPVDGAFTMDAKTMTDVVKRLRARVVLPMHWFSAEGLQAFLTQMGPEYQIRISGKADLMLSRATLPDERQVIVLTPGFIP